MSNFVGLGFSDINPNEKEINSLTQTVFYDASLMAELSYRMQFEFEKEAISEMARATLRRYSRLFDGQQDLAQPYKITIPIGQGFTYSKYNTLMHFLNVVVSYWHNPDLNSIAVFGKDIRALLVLSCQKVFFEEGHAGGFYHYGPLRTRTHRLGDDLDLAVAQSLGGVTPSVSSAKSGGNNLVLTERVYEHGYLRNILKGFFSSAKGERLKTANTVVNLTLLSLMLDFGLYEEYVEILNLPFLQQMLHLRDKRQLQVAVANQIHEFDRKNSTESITRLKLEELIFEFSYKFMVRNATFIYLRRYIYMCVCLCVCVCVLRVVF